MNWLKKTFGKTGSTDKPANSTASIPTIETSTFTLYTITGLVDNLTDDDWTNSEFDPLTDTEKEYIKKFAKENTGKIFYKYAGEYEDIIRGYTKSCDKGRPDLFLGRQVQGKSLVGCISKINGETKSIHIKFLNDTEKEITDKNEIADFLTKIDKT